MGASTAEARGGVGCCGCACGGRGVVALPVNVPKKTRASGVQRKRFRNAVMRTFPQAMRLLLSGFVSRGLRSPGGFPRSSLGLRGGISAKQNATGKNEHEGPEAVNEQVNELLFADRGRPDDGGENAEAVGAGAAQQTDPVD